MKEEHYQAILAAAECRNRLRARKRLTELLCCGHRMQDAIRICYREDPALGIAAERVADEERGGA